MVGKSELDKAQIQIKELEEKLSYHNRNDMQEEARAYNTKLRADQKQLQVINLTECLSALGGVLRSKEEEISDMRQSNYIDRSYHNENFSAKTVLAEEIPKKS